MRKKVITINKEVCLKLAETAFSEPLYQLVDDQRTHLRTWLAWVDLTKSSEDSYNFLRESERFNAGGQRLSYFIFRGEKIIGSVGFVKIDKAQQIGEIGYWIAAHEQGNGIVTKAVKALIDYCFTHSKMNRIEIKVASKNLKSAAIPERLGFTLEGLSRQALKLYDHFHDVKFYGLLKQEWETKS